MNHLKLLAKRLKRDKAETHGYGTRYRQLSILSKNDAYLTKAWKFFNRLPNIVKESIYKPTFCKLATRHLIVWPKTGRGALMWCPAGCMMSAGWGMWSMWLTGAE